MNDLNFKCNKCGRTEGFLDAENQYGKYLICECGEIHKIEEKLPEPTIQTSNIPKCPTCGSPNLKKISTTSKAVNTIAFGLLGTKRHKTFHCNNCGYEW